MGEQTRALAAMPSYRVICCSCFVCCALCIVGTCVLSPGLNPASSWVLVCCRYPVRTTGLSELFFPCRPLEETVCPPVLPQHSIAH